MRYHTFKTKLGMALVAVDERGITFLQFGPNKTVLLATLQGTFPSDTHQRASVHDGTILAAVRAAHACIDGDQPDPSVALSLKGTAFQIQVWRYLQTIPPGAVRTYAEVAKAVGRPKAVRAVASSCARNTLALFIPCHRVVRKDGGLGGYRWGTDKKVRLLAGEKRAR